MNKMLIQSKAGKGVKIQEYEKSETADGGVICCIEPAGKNPSWIIWLYDDGEGVLYTKRAKTGAVLGKAIKFKNTKTK
jgi:hypothetical protein